MLNAMDWAVPGSGAGKLTDPAGSGMAATSGMPTRCIVWEAASMTIICWRCCSSTSMARLPGSTAAITATGPGRVARSTR